MAGISLNPDRLSFAWRHLPATPGVRIRPPLQIGEDDLHIDLVRPRDLVALSVTAAGCELVVAGGVARIRKRSNATAAFLAVELGYQHAHEQAAFEAETVRPATMPNEADPNAGAVVAPNTGNATLTPPVGYLPARGSRLVYLIGDDDEIEFSTAGLLDAMIRLPLSLHRRAGTITDQVAQLPTSQMGDGGGRIDPKVFGDIGDLFLVGDGVVARHTAEGIVIDRASKSEQTRAVDVRVDQASTLSQIVSRSRALGQLRSAIETQGATVRPRVPWNEKVAGRGVLDDIGIVVEPLRPPIRFPRSEFSAPPTVTETAIEAPYRLVITPGAGARFVHDSTGDQTSEHVELWHTRLASAVLNEGAVTEASTEKRADNRPIRAIWTRDRDTLPANVWQLPKADTSGEALDSNDSVPFLGSLTRADRHRIVRQTSERWRLGIRNLSTPTPATANKLWFSALGAWLDLHGQWDTGPYSGAHINSVLAWDHIAPQGRDQFVRVVYPGYLFPLGHRCVLVKITERKIKSPTAAIAGLYQRKFLVVTEPRRNYAKNDFPFTSIELAPLVTPNLVDPGAGQDSFFWPTVTTGKFAFTLHAIDRQQRKVTLATPLLWVAAAADGNLAAGEYDKAVERSISARGQRVAFTPLRNEEKKAPGEPVTFEDLVPKKTADSVLETDYLRLRGLPQVGTAVPYLSSADVTIPAVQRLSPTGPTTISYAADYAAGGITANAGEVWAHVRDNAIAVNGALPGEPISPNTQLRFGQPGAPSDKSGGFVAPSQPIKALSTLAGPVGDIASVAARSFDPAAFFGNALPKLFGLVSLVELVDAGAKALEDAPAIVSDTVSTISQWLKDVEELATLAEQAPAEAQRMLDSAVRTAENQAGELVTQAQQTLTRATEAGDKTVAAATALPPVVQALITGADTSALTDWLDNQLDPALVAIEAVEPHLTPYLKNALGSIRRAIKEVRDAADLVEQVRTMVESLDPAKLALTFAYEWRPKLRDWPSSNPPQATDKPIIAFGKKDKDGLLISARGRVPLQGEPEISTLAELRSFTLNLFGEETLVRIPFDHISFKAGSTGKPEVDIVFGEIEFLGMLSFVETIKDLIPFDGFSDPPFLDVSPEGLKAGFTLALPDLAIGVFTLANMSLGADVNVPFLGKSLSVGFNFCTRERPFTLAVAFLGGGGWFGLRLNPKGLELLELGLEAGACLSVDFGVASGSVSAMIGIYMRLEADKGSLTGYFRLRGEVDVLGLASASIELYLELVYVPKTGKMKGRAVITVQVKVLCFSGSVQIEAERQFAGANGDPSFADVMLEGDDSPAFTSYLNAFDWGSAA